MMTLAAFASIDADPVPGGSRRTHQQAILADLGQALRQAAATWSPAWVGLSQDDSANMVYIAGNSAVDGQYAVVIRGTDFNMLTDDIEDFDVDNAVPFPVGGSVVHIAEGTSKAHNLLIEAVGSSGRTLLEELTSHVGDGAGSTIFVTGHSLGGALATTVALYLQAALPKARFQVYTFAAPTAGLTDFADQYDRTFPRNDPGANSAWRAYNAWDVIPQAWQASTLGQILSWYPSPGPSQPWWVNLVLQFITRLPGNLHYQQPTTNVHQLNNPSWPEALRDPQADFLSQVAFQHDCNTYLTLLRAPNVGVFSSITPNWASRGTDPITLTVSGLGFSRQSTVSFTNSGIAVQSTVVEDQSKLTVTASVADRAPLGACDVIVTSGSGNRIPGGSGSFMVL